MKIIFNPTRTITTSDLFIACDPPMTFKVRAQLTTDWARTHLAWDTNGNTDIDTAIDLVSQAFISVAQEEEYPLDSIENVKALKDAIEQQNAGVGDEFICDILNGFANNHYSFLAKSSANSNK